MANKKWFKKGSLSYRLGLTTLVFLILILSFLTPFMTIEGANKMIGVIIAIVFGVIYVFLVLLTLWDAIKGKGE